MPRQKLRLILSLAEVDRAAINCTEAMLFGQP